MWALFAAVVIAAIATQFNSYSMLAALVLLVVTLIVHFAAGLSLRVSSYKDGVFSVIRFGREFLVGAQRPLERPRGESSPM